MQIPFAAPGDRWAATRWDATQRLRWRRRLLYRHARAPAPGRSVVSLLRWVNDGANAVVRFRVDAVV